MRLDHVSYAAEHDGLSATAERLAKLIGVDPVDGGVHPRFGTRNVILPLARRRYVEIVEVLDHPASYRAPFGQAVRARSEAGGGWLGWVIRVDDIKTAEARVGRPAVDGYRHTPDGAGAALEAGRRQGAHRSTRSCRSTSSGTPPAGTRPRTPIPT